MSVHVSRISRLFRCSVAVSLMLPFLGVMAPAFAASLTTIEPGYLTVGFNGDMPGSSWQDGKLKGVDGEILQKVADELGLKIKPAQMEWSAEIAAVQSGRVDVMLGMMGWKKERTEVMSLSDPLYYRRATVAQKVGQNWCKIADLKNQVIGTITGFSWVDELKKIPGVNLKLYDTSDAAMRDLLSGRISALMADAPLVQYAIVQNPDWGVHQVAFCEPELADYPQITAPGNIVLAGSKANPELIAEISKKIRGLWERCEIKPIAAKYGLTDDVWFTPGKDRRVGVDRPAGWTPPVCKK